MFCDVVAKLDLCHHLALRRKTGHETGSLLEQDVSGVETVGFGRCLRSKRKGLEHVPK